MVIPKYQWKEYLEKEYLELGKTQNTIAKENNVNRGTIKYWLKKYNITRKYKNKIWLKYQYLELNKKASQIAKECNTTTTTIYRWLHNFNITLTKVKGLKHSNSNGEFWYNNGYRWLYKPNHPRTNKRRGGRMQEHIIIVEKSIGRFLTQKERVHHIDLNKLNNDINNLFLCNNSLHHWKIHQELYRIARELVKKKIIKFKNGHYFYDQEKNL